MRKSGILMHISSLNGEYSIGSFGKEARDFIDFLSESGFSVWQTLPFCIPDDCASPYKSFSSFAINPYFIDLPTLHDEGYITDTELLEAKQKSPYLCEFKRLENERLPLLFAAAKRAKKNKTAVSQIKEFIKNRPELEAATLFLALRDKNGGKPWQSWSFKTADADTLFMWEFIQYKAFSQWMKIKEYANSKDIKIIGDVPIYVALDSADVFTSPEEFLLDEKGYPLSVAGVPPDYFSEDGQLWGNPLYNWKRMKADGYSWWKRRIKFMLELFDGVRIDHFRGFEAYFSIPGNADSAKYGRWIKGAGKGIINAIKEVSGDAFIIAEDLGDITDGVRKLLKYSGFPGMRVLQFAFLGDESTPHLLHNFDKNSVAYTGTHDNNTLLGYIYELDAETRAHVFDYFGYKDDNPSEACEVIKRAVLASSADTVIMPIQDILTYGKDTRMNTPGIAEGNWAYRVTKEQLETVDKGAYRHLNKLYGR